MTSKRGRSYYVKRTFRGIGRVQRSLRTTRPAVARHREMVLLKLHGQDRLDLIRAWLDDRVTIEELTHAFDTGRVRQLSERLNRQSMELGRAVDEFLTARGGVLRPRTLVRYQQGLTHFRRLTGAAQVAEALTTDAIASYREQRAQERAALATINVECAAISAFASYCARRGWLDQRPAFESYRVPPRVRYLDHQQLALYMAALRPAFRPMMMLLVRTGMRLGEAERLVKRDMRLRGDGSARIAIPEAKSAYGVRHVFVPEDTASTMAALLRECGPTDRPFTIPRRTVQNEHRRACRIAGIGSYTIHDHRHTAAVHLAEAGMPLPLLKDQLGHRQITETMKYAQFHPDYAEPEQYFARAARKLGLAGDISGDRHEIDGDEWKQ